MLGLAPILPCRHSWSTPVDTGRSPSAIMERMAWAPGARLRNKQVLDALDLCYHVAKQEPREITIQELRAYVKGIVRGQREALLVSEQLPPENVISLYTKRCARQLKQRRFGVGI